MLTHRNPIEVAASLQRREAWPFAYGLLLWLRHVLDAEVNSRGLHRFCSNYDLLLDNWAATGDANKGGAQNSLPTPVRCGGGGCGSLSGRQAASPARQVRLGDQGPFVLTWVRDTLEVLERWAETGEDAVDYDRLDRIHAEFNTAAPLFLNLVHTVRNTRAERDAARAKAEALSVEVVSHQAALETVRTEAQAEVKTLNGHITYRDATLAAQHDKTQAEIKALNAEAVAAARERDALAAGLEREKTRAAALEQTIEALRRQEAQERAWLETTLAERQAPVQTLTQQSQALLQSTSWQLTAPLCALAMVFRK